MSDHPASWLTSRYQLFVAFRYLKARRKQAFTSVVSTVSVLGVVVGVAALIIALALLTGFQGDIQNKIMGANAHIFVQEFGNDTFAGYDEVVRLASNVPGVVAAAPTVLLQGLLQGNLEQPAFVQLKGIDPRGEAKTTELLDRIVEGSPERLLRPYGSPGSLPGIVLGRDLADELAFASVGDIVELIVPSAQSMNPWGGGDVRTPDFEVVGIFDIGMYEYDRTWALISLEAAQSLLEVGERATFVQLKVDDIFATDAIVEQLEEALGDGYYVMDWKRMNRSYFAALQLEKLALFVTISLIVMVAALNIVATLVLMIKDKQRDIGILMSLGATRRDVLWIFLTQGLAIGLLGTLLGCVLGVAMSWLLDTYEVVTLQAEIYYLSYVPFDVRAWDFARVCAFSVLVAFAATLYPAWRASRLDPVVSLRYE